MLSSRHQRARSREQDVDKLDANERRGDAAEAVNQQIAAQQRGRGDRRVRTPRSASGTNATMINALKITRTGSRSKGS